MNSPGTTPLGDLVSDLIADASEPFSVPDVTPPGESGADVSRIVRALAEKGELAQSPDGYYRVWAE